jgi:DNA-binding NtrC family response regulator
MSDSTDHPVQSTIHSASPAVPGRPNVAAGPSGAASNGGPPQTAAASGPQGDRSAQRGTILVIDPAPLSLIALAGVLDTEGYTCICARTAAAAREAMRGQKIETVVCDVADDAPAMLELLAELRTLAGEAELPAVLIADQRWVGLEKKVESLDGTTRCLFKPIDPGSLLAVVEQLLWMPQIVSGHRKRGTRPGRPGWVSL